MPPMTTPTNRAPAQHWLVAVARAQGWPNVEALDLPMGTATDEALATVVVACGIPEDEVLARAAETMRVPLAKWAEVEPHATRLIPERLARKHLVFPVRETAKLLGVATSAPFDLDAEQELQFACGRAIRFELASPTAIRSAIESSYAPPSEAALRLSAANRIAEGLVTAAEAARTSTVDVSDVDAPPIVNLVNLIITDGVKRRSSDIHIEPGRLEGLVRYRIDGVMQDYLKLPMPVLSRVVSRIKILGQLDIADRMRPQDGRARIMFNDKSIDLRLSTVPTRDAEKAVIRILDSGESKSLESIGFPAAEFRRIKTLLRQRDGIVVVTGPTGSGKTTTLYSAVREIASGSVNVVTIEDPVEYDLAGITQIQVETKRGVSFAGALRAVLRQDPDVILVGEVRDAETAQTAAHAALTGHLVLTTLHTNDAVGVLQRLLDLGLEAGTVGDALRGVIAQRLLRSLCPKCAVAATAPYTAEEERLMGYSGVAPVRRAVGCDDCAGTGYRGRLAVPEVLVCSEAIEKAIAEGAPVPAVLQMARGEGMRLLHEVALDAVRDGRTTLDEVERVIGIPDPLFDSNAATAPAAAAAAVPGPATAAPAAPATTGAAAASAPPPPVPARPAAAAPQTPLILLVDDDPVSRIAANVILTGYEMEVHEATDGLKALEYLATCERLPSLLLLDLEMPGVDGETVVRRLRSDPRTRRMPIIILTGSEDREQELILMEEGADDYLNKPIEPERLIVRVRAALRRAALV